ncbi:hypothetical protein SDC9_113871 [bioreactor metagenome]|uniref:Uncharacterized protein n=1 Tax=bioreactor metagenome TaxID=1076179 RepID=A0A645BNZ4_9ZZZZ
MGVAPCQCLPGVLGGREHIDPELPAQTHLDGQILKGLSPCFRRHRDLDGSDHVRRRDAGQRDDSLILREVVDPARLGGDGSRIGQVEREPRHRGRHRSPFARIPFPDEVGRTRLHLAQSVGVPLLHVTILELGLREVREPQRHQGERLRIVQRDVDSGVHRRELLGE